MSVVLLRKRLDGVVKSGTFMVKDWERDVPQEGSYIHVGGRHVRYSVQSNGLAVDNPGNAGVFLRLELKSYDSDSTGIVASEQVSNPFASGWKDLGIAAMEYVVPVLHIYHPLGAGQDVELDGTTTLEVRLFP